MKASPGLTSLLVSTTSPHMFLLAGLSFSLDFSSIQVNLASTVDMVTRTPAYLQQYP